RRRRRRFQSYRRANRAPPGLGSALKSERPVMSRAGICTRQGFTRVSSGALGSRFTPRAMNTPRARAILVAGILLGSTQCAAPLDGSIDEAPEAEQRSWAGVPRWTVYQTGQDFYYGTAVNEIGRHVKHYYAHPRDLDRFSRVVAIPPGGE